MIQELRNEEGQRGDMYGLEGIVDLNDASISSPVKELPMLKREKGIRSRANKAIMVESTQFNERATGKKCSQCGYFKMMVHPSQKADSITAVVEKGVDEHMIVHSDKAKNFVDITYRVCASLSHRSDSDRDTATATLPWARMVIRSAERIFQETCHWLYDSVLQNYLNEICYKLNRRYMGERRFERLAVADDPTRVPSLPNTLIISTMKAFTLVSLLLFLSPHLWAQNLVANHDFSLNSSCPNSNGQIFKATDWDNVPGTGPYASPDYMACMIGDPGSHASFIVPDNFRGPLDAHAGIGYAGAILHRNYGSMNFREYFYTTLTSTMEAGVDYDVGFWVSPAKPGTSKYLTNNGIQIHFSNAPLNQGGTDNIISLTPSFTYTGPTISSRLQWTNITFTYTATGGEQYMTVGNFLPVGATNVVTDNESLGNHSMYYFFDNFSVIPTGIGPLPIELLKFKVELQENEVSLEWTTVSEISNDYFTVERSASGIGWDEVTVVDGQGNSSIQVNYSATDFLSEPGTYYYRLKQTDFDGQTDHSDIVSINFNSDNSHQIYAYPNPSENEITIESSKESLLDQLKIYNFIGQDVTNLVQTSIRTEKAVKLDLSQLTSGMYYLNSETSFIKIHKK